MTKSEELYPGLVVALSKNADNPSETILMRALAKEEKVPLDYWAFVNGRPRGYEKNLRPLLPFEVHLLFDL